MQKYLTQITENFAVIQWMETFGLYDVHDALEKVSGAVAGPVPLLVIDHATEFDPSFDELQNVVAIFEKFKSHFTDKVAFVPSKEVHYGLGHMLHILFSKIGVIFVPFREIDEAREWLSETPP